VKLVEHKNSNDLLAMKIIRKRRYKGKEEKENIINEIKCLKELDHPNIIKLFELFEDKKSLYLITEYCDGGELFDKLVSLGSFTENLAARIFSQMLSAIVFCHSSGIAHRDLKPENMLIES
jgi:calcium-dependent protein kinase